MTITFTFIKCAQKNQTLLVTIKSKQIVALKHFQCKPRDPNGAGMRWTKWKWHCHSKRQSGVEQETGRKPCAGASRLSISPWHNSLIKTNDVITLLKFNEYYKWNPFRKKTLSFQCSSSCKCLRRRTAKSDYEVLRKSYYYGGTSNRISKQSKLGASTRPKIMKVQE